MLKIFIKIAKNSSMAKIQIFSVLGKNGRMFSDFLRKTMIALSGGNHELEFNCFMSSRTKSPKGWKTLECIIKQKHTSLNHTIGMNRALDYIDGNYVVFSDTDVAMLAPNWDQYLIDTIDKYNIDILGVGYLNVPRSYKNFPIVTFFMSKSSSHLQAQPDMRPNLVANELGIGSGLLTIKTQQEVDIYNKPLGSKIMQDSGWQLPRAYKSAGFNGKVLDAAPPYVIPLVPQMWYFDKTPGLCHKGKGTKRRKGVAIEFFKSVKKYLIKTYGIDIKP